MRTAEEFEKAAQERGITEWLPFQCSLCHQRHGYRFIDGGVFRDSSCGCTRSPWPLVPKSAQDLADLYNRQTHPRVIAEYDAFWGFTS